MWMLLTLWLSCHWPRALLIQTMMKRQKKDTYVFCFLNAENDLDGYSSQRAAGRICEHEFKRPWKTYKHTNLGSNCFNRRGNVAVLVCACASLSCYILLLFEIEWRLAHGCWRSTATNWRKEKLRNPVGSCSHHRQAADRYRSVD